jgi:hypothetical protein
MLGFLCLIVVGVMLVFSTVGIFVAIIDKDEKLKNRVLFLLLCGIILIPSFWFVKHSFSYHEDILESSKQIYVEDWKYDLVALKDNRDIKGNFHGGLFVSSGYINQDLYYYYIIDTSKGKAIQKISASNTYIDDTSLNVQPTVSCGHYEFEDSNWYRDIFWTIFPYQGKECYLVVPTGTIDKTFNINLE